MRNSGVRVRIGVLAIIVALAVFLPASARTARAQSAAGTVSSAGGQVQIQRGGVTLAATPGTPVKQGDKIVSGADGHAVIILTDGSKLELSHSTTITLDQYTSGGPTPTRVGLASGILESVVRGIGGAPANYQVHTPNAIGAVRGTDFLHLLHLKFAAARQPPRNLPLHRGGRDRRRCQLGAGYGAQQRR